MRETRSGLWPDSIEELVEIIKQQTDIKHDYNTAVDALVECTVAAFNYVASNLGMTGAQASYAELAFIKKTRGLEGPFAILDGSKLLYPQYDLEAEFDKYMEEWPAQLAPKARELLNEPHGANEVRNRWYELSQADRIVEGL